MNMHSRLLDALKSVDSVLGKAAARHLSGSNRALPEAPRDVLVVRLWGLGNLAILAPQLHAVRGQVRVRLLTLERNGEFLTQHMPWVQPLLIPDPTSVRFAPRLLSTLAGLRRDPPDLIVDLEQFLRLPCWAVRTASGAPSVGLDTPGQGRRPLLDHAVAHDPTRHVADTFAALWGAAGLPTAAGPGPLRSVPGALHAELSDALEASPGRGPWVVLHPGSGDHFPGRRWDPERFGQLASRLVAQRGARVILTGHATERPLVDRVRNALGTAQYVDLTGRLDSAALVALLARADLLVTNDTGPLHLADAVGTRAVALYGPNTPHRYGPRTPGSRAVFADLPCSPCLDDRSMKRSRCRSYECMTVLSVDAVLTACLEVLDGRGSRTPRKAVHAVAR